MAWGNYNHWPHIPASYSAEGILQACSSKHQLLFTKTATKNGLTKYLLANSFKKSRHFLEEMNTVEMFALYVAWINLGNVRIYRLIYFF